MGTEACGLDDVFPSDGLRSGPGAGPRLNIKTAIHRYGDSHDEDKTDVSPSYL